MGPDGWRTCYLRRPSCGHRRCLLAQEPRVRIVEEVHTCLTRHGAIQLLAGRCLASASCETHRHLPRTVWPKPWALANGDHQELRQRISIYSVLFQGREALSHGRHGAAAVGMQMQRGQRYSWWRVTGIDPTGGHLPRRMVTRQELSSSRSSSRRRTTASGHSKGGVWASSASKASTDLECLEARLRQTTSANTSSSSGQRRYDGR
mmetsp:Transcript_9298/g.23979  ORF Transcript_9298/g.23979 Transcript_9298/m.23979 type:complete len:206 (-) Transcript_9298:335-952(-)